MNRHFICINAQTIIDNKICVFNLSLNEMNCRSTSENLSNILKNVLIKHKLSTKNIISLTIDNAANMVKLGEILKLI